MSISTYAELQTAVTNWLHRSDLSAYVADFITIGEARIGREVKARQMEQRVSSTPTTVYMNLPSDYVSMRALRIESSSIGWLDYETPDKFFSEFPSAISSTSCKYTIFGDELVFPTVPAGAVELWYYKKLSALSSEVNTLFTSNPDLYLYAALAASQPFLKDDKRIPVWEGLYGEVREAVNQSHKVGRYPSGLYIKTA